jgi:hypothetical protein
MNGTTTTEESRNSIFNQNTDFLPKIVKKKLLFYPDNDGITLVYSTMLYFTDFFYLPDDNSGRLSQRE